MASLAETAGIGYSGENPDRDSFRRDCESRNMFVEKGRTNVVVVFVGFWVLLSTSSLLSSCKGDDESRRNIVSFSGATTSRILRGDVTLKSFDTYVVYAEEESGSPEGTESLRCLHEAANELKDTWSHVLFIHAKNVTSYPSIAESLAINDSETSAKGSFRLLDPSSPVLPTVYPIAYEAPCSTKMIHDALKLFQRHELQSLKRPTSRYGDAIRSAAGDEAFSSSLGGITIEADKFRSSVLEPESTDAVLFVYNPSCPICERFVPEWNDLVESLKDVSTLEFFSMDGNGNEVLGLSVVEYPSIFLFAGFDKAEAKLFKGERVSSVVREWVHQNAARRFTLSQANPRSEL